MEHETRTHETAADEMSTPETSTPGRGSPESAAWFRERLHVLGIGQSALARLMLEHGDDRQLATILRSLGRMANGDARVSGEMRALLGVMSERQAKVAATAE